MQVYLVGGAVRDQLLHLPVTERDWVVVGATPEALLQLGYQQVGKDFPVFLHPETKEEYALARTERKSGRGYTGFICDFAPSITLEEDLKRRDLTINAIAQRDDGTLIDPFHGVEDLNQRLLRHVSDAFREDPLRLLRVARFAARFHHLGFTIAPETFQLMQQMVADGELNYLTPERVWRETEKALHTQSPQIYFAELQRCGALAILLPELNNLFGVPAPVRWHPEIDSGLHSLMTLQQAAKLTADAKIRFAAICHDLGKGVTPKALWPHHKGHSEAGLALIKQHCQRLKVPNDYRDCALRICRFHDQVHKILSLSPEQILALLDGIDVWRNPHHLQQLIIAAEADYRGRLGWENRPYPAAKQLAELYQQAQSVAVQPIIAQGFQGAEIKAELQKQRLENIAMTLTKLQAE